MRAYYIQGGSSAGNFDVCSVPISEDSGYDKMEEAGVAYRFKAVDAI